MILGYLTEADGDFCSLIFVELNSIQKVPVKEGNHPPPLAATSRSRQPPSHHRSTAVFTLGTVDFRILNLCINRVLSYVNVCGERIERNIREKERVCIMSFV